jgi:hypothetical protein
MACSGLSEINALKQRWHNMLHGGAVTPAKLGQKQ